MMRCARCGEILTTARYLNMLMVCRTCYWSWKKNMKTKFALSFEDWLKERKYYILTQSLNNSPKENWKSNLQ